MNSIVQQRVCYKINGYGNTPKNVLVNRFLAIERAFFPLGVLKEYKDELEKEAQGVSEKIKDLEKS